MFVVVTIDERGQEEGWRGLRGDTLKISIARLSEGDLWVQDVGHLSAKARTCERPGVAAEP